jgi:hypothetical protein
MTVNELITVLQTFPGDAPAGVLTAAPSGLIIDIGTAPVVTVEQTMRDDGTVDTVWITGIGDTAVNAPTLITWPCDCGQLLTIDQYATWPHDHDSHLWGLHHQP